VIEAIIVLCGGPVLLVVCAVLGGLGFIAMLLGSRIGCDVVDQWKDRKNPYHVQNAPDWWKKDHPDWEKKRRGSKRQYRKAMEERLRRPGRIVDEPTEQ